MGGVAHEGASLYFSPQWLVYPLLFSKASPLETSLEHKTKHEGYINKYFVDEHD